MRSPTAKNCFSATPIRIATHCNRHHGTSSFRAAYWPKFLLDKNQFLWLATAQESHTAEFPWIRRGELVAVLLFCGCQLPILLVVLPHLPLEQTKGGKVFLCIAFLVV